MSVADRYRGCFKSTPIFPRIPSISRTHLQSYLLSQPSSHEIPLINFTPSMTTATARDWSAAAGRRHHWTAVFVFRRPSLAAIIASRHLCVLTVHVRTSDADRRPYNRRKNFDAPLVQTPIEERVQKVPESKGKSLKMF